MPAHLPAPTRFEHTTTPTVLRIDRSMRILAAVLAALFNGLMVGLLIFSLVRLSNIGLGVLVAVVISAMTWALWKIVQTRMILTDDQVILKYGFFPTVRIDRSSITGIELRNVSYIWDGGGNVYTPYLVTSDGHMRPVFMMGRRSQGPALEQVADLRRRLGV